MNVPIPGPKPWPIIGNLLDIDIENSIQSFSNLCLKYGPILKVTFSGKDIIFLSGHELVHEMSSHKDCVKLPAASIKEMQVVTPKGLFTADPGQRSWELAHRILVPAFGPLAIEEMFQEMHDIASQLILRWARFGESRRIDVASEFTRLTLDTIALCAMDTRINSFSEEQLHPFVSAMTSALAECENRVVIPRWLHWLRRRANQKFQDDVNCLHQVAAGVVARRRSHPTEKKDFLNTMLYGKDPVTEEQLDDQTIVDNIITFLVAGHETTSGLLSFTFALLLKHPRVYKKLQDEVDNVLEGGPITPFHIRQLSYVKACLKESLRLYPPSAGFPIAIQGDPDQPFFLQGKYAIKRNEAVFVLIPPLHREKAAYGDDADEFKPERMLDENFKRLPPGCFKVIKRPSLVTHSLLTAALKAFGTGMRACIGSEFALQEAILATALLFQKFDFQLADSNYEITIKEALTLKPRDLFMYARMRPGVNTLTLPINLFCSSTPSPVGRDTGGLNIPFRSRSEPMAIYFGSNTGTCQGLAEQLVKSALQRGFTCTVQALDHATGNIPTDQPVVFISSTQYEGQPPGNSVKFVRWLDEVEQGSLRGVRCAVFGCGSSDWKNTHQKIAFHIHGLLKRNAAHIIAPLGLADVAKGNVLSDFDTWQSDELWPAIQRVFPQEAAATIQQDPIDLLQGIGSVPTDYLQLNVLEVRELTTAMDGKKYHMEVELPHGTIYSLGDYLEVYPMNSQQDMEGLLSYSRSRGLHASDQLLHEIHACLEMRQPASLKQIELLCEACQNSQDRTKIEGMLQSLSQDCERRPTVLRLLEIFPNIYITIQQLITMLPPIRPRQYSISSSPLASPGSITLTWSLVTHSAPAVLPDDHFTVGLASHYLASLQKGDILHCTLRQGQQRFQPPTSPESTPMIMICAGSGLAPFRGFIQDRAERIKRDPSLRSNLAPAILYVGCRTPNYALYTMELEEWQAAGAVEVYYSYSRQDPKNGPGYVQDLIWSDREHFLQLWDSGAKILVCGSGVLSYGVKEVVQRIYCTCIEKGSVKQGLGFEEWWIYILRERYITEIWG